MGERGEREAGKQGDREGGGQGEERWPGWNVFCFLFSIFYYYLYFFFVENFTIQYFLKCLFNYLLSLSSSRM